MESSKMWVVLSCVFLIFTSNFVNAAEEGTCYGGGSIAGAVFGTLFATIALIALGYLIYRYYWETRKDKHLVLMSDPENVKDEFAFDNPGFKEGAPPPAGVTAAGGGSGWLRSQAPPNLAPSHDKHQNSHPNQQKNANGSAQQNTDKRKNGESVGARLPMQQNQGKGFLDDTFAEKRREATVVPLWSRDFTGLGFEVCGNMRDGIFVSSVLRGGPAYESGRIHTGDRINSVSISTRHMVYEDALAILSHASPYEIHLEVEQQQSGLNLGTGGLNYQTSTGVTGVAGGTLDRRSTAGQMNQSGAVVHPLAAKAFGRLRAGSYGDINTLEKASRQNYFPRQSPNSTLDTSSQSKNNTSAGSAIKKMITDKINITSGASLERNNKANNHQQHMHGQTTTIVTSTTTLERENEKNAKNHTGKTHHGKIMTEHTVVNYDSDPSNKDDKPERNNRNKDRTSAPPDVVIIKDGGDRYSAKVEKVDVQKKEADSGKKGMKFGIRVLPPNVPDDGTLSNRNSKVDIGKGFGENGNIVTEIRSIDEVDKHFDSAAVTPGKESTKPKAPIPVVAKRREKPAAPIPNARNLPQNVSSGNTNISMTVETIKIDPVISGKNTEVKMDVEVSGFDRSDDLNSSGIKRDSQGIPQEIPQHMMEAAMYARSNRKGSTDFVSSDKQKQEYVSSKYSDSKKSDLSKIEKELSKNSKKSKGKAPSPPEGTPRSRDDNDNSSDTDVSSVTQETMIGVDMSSKDRKGLNFTDNFTDQTFHDPHSFIEAERDHTNRLQNTNRTDDMILGKSLMNTSTPKAEKVVKRMRPDVPTQKVIDIPDDLDSYGLKPYHRKEASESMNNLYEDSKSNISSNMDGSSMMSQDSFASNVMSELDKIGNASTTIELNSSDITIHSSPVTEHGDRDADNSDDNERKAASLGDLSKLEPADKNSRKPSQGTLERAQSLDISAEDAKIIASEKHITPKKRKSNSVFDGSYYDNVNDDLPTDSNESVNQLMGHSKEPRLSLNISNISSMEGLNTFQRNRLKKASEWGNMEDALMMKKNIADSSNSGSSEIANSAENLNEMADMVTKVLEDENVKLNDEINKLKFISNDAVGEAIDKASLKTIEINNFKSSPTNVTVGKSTSDFNIGDIRIDTVSHMRPEISSHSTIEVHSKTAFTKPEVPSRIKTELRSEINEQLRPNFEIGTYVSDASSAKYKTDGPAFASSRLSPKMEDKLTMIYDTNIPDDIKVSRHSLVSSLERPKSDLMKKLLAQNPVLNVGVESQTDLKKGVDNVTVDKPVSGENAEGTSAENFASTDFNDKDSKANSTTLTLINQPDIVNLRIKQHSTESKSFLPTSSNTVVSGEVGSGGGISGAMNESDFVSNINIVGTTTKGDASKMNLKFDTSSAADKVQTRNFFSTNDNVVTISTDGSQPSSIITIEGEAPVLPNVVESFRNSIEINRNENFSVPIDITGSQSEQSLYNEIISEMQKPKSEHETHGLSSSTMTNTRTYMVDGGVVTEERTMTPYIVDSQTVNLPPQKTVTVNVTYDEHGNKIVTQNVEETTTRLVTIQSSLPIEIEEYTFGVIRNPTAEDIQRIEESNMGTGVDFKMLSDIERQNPNIRFTSNDPMYSNTDTMMVNADMTEEETRALLTKLKDNPQMFMDGNRIYNQKSTVIRETEMISNSGNDNFDGQPIVKMTQSSYKFNIEDGVQNSSPAKIVKMIESDTRRTVEDFNTSYNSSHSSEAVNKMASRINNKGNSSAESIYLKSEGLSSERRDSGRHDSDAVYNRMEIKSNAPPAEDFITEIEVVTPRSEKLSKQKSDLEKSKQYYSDKMSTYYSEPNLSNEIDISLMGDFLNSERRFSAKERVDSEKYERSKSTSPDSIQNGKESRRQSNEDQSKMKRHSDFDLPRNTHIKFRTATYEPLTAPPSRLSSSEKRLSQIEILKSNFEKGGSSENVSNMSSQNSTSSAKPAVSMKPSSIPIKLPELKTNTHMKTPTISPSKIPVLNSGKSTSQENLLDGARGLGMQKTSPHGKLSASTGNISVTSIKSSSRNPSGK